MNDTTKRAFELAVIAFSSLCMSVGFNLFLVPHQLLSGGVAGISMLIGYFTGGNIGWLYFAMNVPILLWGWLVIGKKFIVYSIVSVLCTTWFMLLIPVETVTSEPLLGAVFGGVLVALGMAFSLRIGGSTGGFDIIGYILSRSYNFSLGNVLFVMNGCIILILGALINWDLALYTMLSIYIRSRIVDMIHVGHVKVTAYIVTQKKDEMVNRLLKLPHGVTCIKTNGAFSSSENHMLMTVTTRYELAELRKAIREVDPQAFVNIVQTLEVMGRFGKRTA
jgi:uncharacterized membrane-anchored protein YitT (DUF2179 family)